MKAKPPISPHDELLMGKSQTIFKQKPKKPSICMKIELSLQNLQMNKTIRKKKYLNFFKKHIARFYNFAQNNEHVGGILCSKTHI